MPQPTSLPTPPCLPAEWRMNRIIDFIDAHLDETLTLDRLASQAHLSRFHFLRLFQAWTREAPYAFVRRRRLEYGASQLLYSSLSITTVAGACGFDSSDGFTRAFRQHFGLAPLSWRHLRQDQVRSALAVPSTRAAWSHRFAYRPPVRVAYLRLVGPYGQADGADWARLSDWLNCHGVTGTTRFGMGLDDPSLTAPIHCRYDLCAELPESFPCPSGTPHKMIAGGTFAILSYQGLRENSARAWHHLLDVVIPRSSYCLAPGPAFERYATHVDPAANILDCELCLPVRRRALGLVV